MKEATKKNMSKNPYTLSLAYQLAEIPYQMAHFNWYPQLPNKAQYYRFGNKWRQYLLFWPHANPEKTRESVLVFYHGGAWRAGWPQIFPNVAAFFLQAGFPVCMPAYRLSPWFQHRHMREDIDSAMLILLELMKINNLQSKKLLIGGMSAGAELAAHLCFDKQRLNKLGFDQSRISGFFSIGGPLDLDQMPPFNALRQYTGGKPGSAQFQEANPVNFLDGAEKIPTFFLHGSADAIVPMRSAAAFASRYAGPKEWVEIPEGTHLGSMRFTTDNTFYAEKMLRWLHDK